MVRIIAGEAKGNVLRVPKSTNKVRPTSDRVKEALFSSLADHIIGAKVLDLFSGTGNLGLEALSRGAKECFFIEKNNICLKYLEWNIDKLGFQDRCTVCKGDFFKLINRIKLFDINLVFADPPYDETNRLFSENTNILNILLNSAIVARFAYFVLEHRKNFEVPYEITEQFGCKTKNYGSTSITIFKLAGDKI